ncbi:hypothetical protein HH214_16860 [Mucilaginibacter robiniae]|uniref:DUF922 domain-containing protein n=1 Tax=Mucilaginibacter robiniae TaxID=2728022 RepID=A0A7L5E2A6_9SPHI|nr:hypothetical protein [Mucilaginibacter robiniae]QJD97422.1 hypothetical protein HH214_16860 [Mucilaginibacter robiniae]
MIKNITPSKSTCAFMLSGVLILLCCAFNKGSKPPAALVLQDERLSFSPKEFYIQSVVDERKTHSAVAWLITDAASGATQSIDLQGGAGSAIHQFINHGMSANTVLRAIVIRIKELKITESVLPNKGIDGKINIAFSFYRKVDETYLHLADYQGTAHYIRPDRQMEIIEPTLRRTLENALTYLNTWMSTQAEGNLKLAKQVKWLISDYTDQTDPDTIYYNPKRPLNWDDFKGRPQGSSRYAAEVFPSMAFDEDVDVAKSVIQVNLKLKVYVPKTDCWVRNGSRDDYTLNHEQRHFDITKLACEHFKQALQTEPKSVTNYDGAVHADYLEAFSQMGQLQQQYDRETQHGLNIAEQERWNKRIDDELNKLGIR